MVATGKCIDEMKAIIKSHREALQMLKANKCSNISASVIEREIESLKN